jgi:hypothetical protein
MTTLKQGPLPGAQATKLSDAILQASDPLNNVPVNLVLELLGEVIREIEVDFVDLCFFSAALGVGKPLLPDDFIKLHKMASRFHAFANGVKTDEHS